MKIQEKQLETGKMRKVKAVGVRPNEPDETTNHCGGNARLIVKICLKDFLSFERLGFFKQGVRVGTESVNIAVLSGPGRARQKKPIFL